jgi:hypothetical protein
VPFDPFLRGEGYEFCGVAPLFAKQSKAKALQSKANAKQSKANAKQSKCKAKQSKCKGKRKGKCKFATPFQPEHSIQMG